MQMHPDFTTVAGNHIAREFDIGGINRHFIVGQPCGFKGILLAKLLESRQKKGVFRCDTVMVLPKVIAFGIDGDDKRGLSHFPSCSEIYLPVMLRSQRQLRKVILPPDSQVAMMLATSQPLL
jgi:hypothetical protein